MLTSAATVVFGIVPSPLIDFSTHAGEGDRQHARAQLTPRECSAARPLPLGLRGAIARQGRNSSRVGGGRGTFGTDAGRMAIWSTTALAAVVTRSRRADPVLPHCPNPLPPVGEFLGRRVPPSRRSAAASASARPARISLGSGVSRTVRCVLHHVTLEVAAGGRRPVRGAARRDRVRAGTGAELAGRRLPLVRALRHAGPPGPRRQRRRHRPSAMRRSSSRRSSRRSSGSQRTRLRRLRAPPALGIAAGRRRGAGRAPHRAHGDAAWASGFRSRDSHFAARLRSIVGPLNYPVETFTEAERIALEPHFSNLDRPVFALTNLPETVKGALFARYSRYQGTLRRLYLDEFAADTPEGARPFDGAEGERAAQLYERIFIGYGDDSVAQLGGGHLACEWVSNVLTKVLQRGRLAAYLEQSTRYIPYDAPMSRGPRAGRAGQLALLARRGARARSSAPRWTRSSRSTRRRSSRCAPGPRSAGRAATSRRAPGSARSRPRRSTCFAGSCRRRPSPTSASTPPGRPTSSCCSGSPPPRSPRPARSARWPIEELGAIIPSFISRVGRPERGGEWISYLEQRRADTERWVARLGLDRRGGSDAPTVELIHVDGDEDQLLAASPVRGDRAAGERDRQPDRHARSDRAGGHARRPRRRARQPSPPPGPRLGGGSLPLRDRLRLRRLPRHAAASDADLPVAVARPRPRRGGSRGGGRGRCRRRVRPRAGDLPERVPPARGGGDAGGRALRALPRLPDPVRARHERPRGDARLRASLRPRGSPDLPRRRPGDARADRRRPSGDRRRHAPRRLDLRAAPGADHERDPHAPKTCRARPDAPDAFKGAGRGDRSAKRRIPSGLSTYPRMLL